MDFINQRNITIKTRGITMLDTNVNYQKLNNLIELRKNNLLKQKEIANYLSYDRSYYSKIENGLYELKIHDACKLCLLLNCDIYFIYGIKRHYEPLDDETRSSIEKFLKNNPDKF